MRLVIQRVASASVDVDGVRRGQIDRGLLVLAGLLDGDAEADLVWSAEKIAELRIFPDELGKMNRSVKEINGGVLLIPNFTLSADGRKGRRPSFDSAMKPDLASPMFDRICDLVGAQGVRVERGVFRAHMVVSLVNDGPVTIVIDSRDH
ncbi:MAG: D-tyrosyl-tRNA(Tyr) deacylase [Phycisphaerales bacterium]|nr:D-tyrosyl-tRNA(Tyr) deacylase [Phycisphaerales bacterium]